MSTFAPAVQSRLTYIRFLEDPQHNKLTFAKKPVWIRSQSFALWYKLSQLAVIFAFSTYKTCRMWQRRRNPCFQISVDSGMKSDENLRKKSSEPERWKLGANWPKLLSSGLFMGINPEVLNSGHRCVRIEILRRKIPYWSCGSPQCF